MLNNVFKACGFAFRAGMHIGTLLDPTGRRQIEYLWNIHQTIYVGRHLALTDNRKPAITDMQYK